MSLNPLSEATNKALVTALDNLNVVGAGQGAVPSAVSALGHAERVASAPIRLSEAQLDKVVHLVRSHGYGVTGPQGTLPPLD
ncbi:hypothetical protein [Streptomyces formicae]|uniref:Uncharacterized protein n=1 Tax=Streptomyces formicae TaxID=1616117 RepID=A0A291QB99_9ACTN|nr:hypothetical protein [Streptomyces formicae]ATL28981.1 hypothetical protein KY5_3963c [Streptomyces formicae]